MADSPRPHINFTWSVDTTANRVISVSTDVIRACTSDNVQPLALLACERFGAQLAMCMETRMKMESLAKRKHISLFFKHLSGAIGYLSGDTADYLASSDAGVRFLGLAAALLTLGSNFNAAQVLHHLLSEFSSKDQMQPSVGQLKDLFQKLEPKMMCSGFADQLMGWSTIILSQDTALHKQCIGKYLQTPDFSQVGGENRSQRASLSARGETPCNDCPHDHTIAQMLQAMSEIQRLGEATYAVFRVPANIAVWVITSVKWCMGVPPSTRCRQDRGSYESQNTLKQPDSKIMVEIIEPGSQDESIQVFKKVDDMHNLLWQSRSLTQSSVPWAGMVTPKVYFRHRLQELQTVYGLFHVSQFMLLIARDFGGTIQSSDESYSKYATRPFPPSIQLVQLVRHLLHKGGQSEPREYGVEQLRRLWLGQGEEAIGEAANLFIELLALSVIENAYEVEPDFFLNSRSGKKVAAFKNLKNRVVEFIRGSENTNTPGAPVTTMFQLHQLALIITGTDGQGNITSPLISSKNGQVTYLALLEDLEILHQGPIRFRVFAGSLISQGQHYAFAEAEDLMNTGQILEDEKVTTEDFAPAPMAPTQIQASQPRSKWFFSHRDNYLSILFNADLQRDYWAWPTLFVTAPEGMIPCKKCTPPCPELGDFQAEILYCRTIAAALSDMQPQAIRVLECTKLGKSHVLFVQAVLEHIRYNRFASNPYTADEGRIVLTQGESCLGHAYEMAIDILLALYPDDDVGTKKAVILA